MKETIQDLLTRRSCRAYRPEQVEEETLQTILEAATYAPTGKGLQSPKIVVVQDKETRDEISRLNGEVVGMRGADPFYGAPTVVIVFQDTTSILSRDDANLVIGNMLNAAHALGVDSCFIYRARECFKTPEGRALMEKWGLDEKYEGVGNVILGYGKPEGIRPAVPRKEDYIIRV